MHRMLPSVFFVGFITRIGRLVASKGLYRFGYKPGNMSQSVSSLSDGYGERQVRVDSTDSIRISVKMVLHQVFGGIIYP